MDTAIIVFLLFLIIPALLVTLYIRREIRNRQDAARERMRQLEDYQRRQYASLGNPKSVSRRPKPQP
jgi:hypothetical protein